MAGSLALVTTSRPRTKRTPVYRTKAHRSVASLSKVSIREGVRIAVVGADRGFDHSLEFTC